MNLNIKSDKAQTYDAIVVGSGMTGGMAAKELTERGLKVLMLERGYEVKHVEDYKTAMKDPWEFEHRGKITNVAAEEHYASMYFSAKEGTQYLYTNDKENPYIQKRPFNWIRAYHTGGKSLLWGKQSYRWNREDFLANAKQGLGVEWPIGYDDLVPWYDYVEKFVGVSGQAEGLDVLPDGQFLPPMAMTAPEQHLKKSVMQKLNRTITIGRVAHLTKPQPWHTALGRAQCQFRNRCSRGCPFGAYFSSLAATIPAARQTNRLTVVHNAIVKEILLDSQGQKAKGVRVIDQNTMEVREFYAKIIFLNAGTIGSTSILMNSKSSRFPTGLGNDSDQLGRNLMDHHLSVGARADIEGFENDYYFGARPNALYIPRFRNWGSDKRGYLRGFGYQGGASRADWARGGAETGFGADFKAKMTQPGPWKINLSGFGEVLPDPNNRFYLSDTQTDKWGLPVVVFDADFGENERAMRKDIMNDGAEMLEAAGFKNVVPYDNAVAHMGLGIHEMGTARMGKDPKTSVLNKFNQVHACKNIFVTDGSAMTSASNVNPSITYMALTARAAKYAVDQLKARSL
ncbi:GMC oxidoreductase [Spirosoma litoris]